MKKNICVLVVVGTCALGSRSARAQSDESPQEERVEKAPKNDKKSFGDKKAKPKGQESPKVTGESGDAEQVTESKEDSRFPLMTWDLGASFGSSGGYNFWELGLGLETYFAKWMSWRNLAFYRSSSQFSAYGLDSSARGHARASLGDVAGFHVYGGPGWRFANQNLSAPFGELGVNLKLGGLGIGLGVKFLMLSWIHSGAKDQTLLTLNLAGGGSL